MLCVADRIFCVLFGLRVVCIVIVCCLLFLAFRCYGSRVGVCRLLLVVGLLSIVSWRMSFVGCWMWLVVCLLCVVCWSLLLFGCMLLVDCRSVRVVCVVL